MSGWLAIDLECSTCGSRWDTIVPRDLADLPLPCLCGGEGHRVPSRPNPMRRSFRDGVRRFDGLRAQDVLDRAASEAAWRGDAKEGAKVAQEKDKLGRSKRGS